MDGKKEDMSQTRYRHMHPTSFPGAGVSPLFAEEGSAFLHITAQAARRESSGSAAARAAAPTEASEPPALARLRAEPLDVLVIGAGQAGLSVGYFLAASGLSFAILDANQRVGDQWRRRWDSLRLFTPARFDGLVGMPFPAPPNSFPTKDEMADYLEEYARHFRLPVVCATPVDRLSKEGDLYVATSGRRRFVARQVVVAMATYQKPKIPALARELDSGIWQIHSSDYRNPSQLRGGGVLVVGAGNSGSEIAIESARNGHETWMSGRDTGHIPFRIGGFAGRHFLLPFVLRVLFQRVFTLGTPLGRRVRPKVVGRGGPLIRIKPGDIAAAGVQRVPRVEGVRDGKPLLADGRVLNVANVVWSTGFHPGFSWIDLPVFDGDAEPEHERGVVEKESGLYFVGLHFLYAFSSTMIHGIERDARHVAGVIAKRVERKRREAAAS